MVLMLETKADFDTFHKDNPDKLCVVYFTASWCGPCKAISPKYEEMVEEYLDVAFAKVDVDDNEETSEHCDITAMPTFIFYKNGAKVERFTGANAIKVRNIIDENK